MVRSGKVWFGMVRCGTVRFYFLQSFNDMKAYKTDKNQKEIVAALRKMGMSVAITSALGYGFPDICVGYRGNNYLFEIKDPRQPPSGRKLTPAEELFHTAWRGSIYTITTVDEIMGVIFSGTF